MAIRHDTVKRGSKMLKFFYNGIKENGGKLQKAHYSKGGWMSFPEEMITIYARDYKHFSPEIQESFPVQNDTDSMTDYFCKDTIRVLPDNKFYNEVLEAYVAQQEHRKKMRNKREAA
jgi:hypothetical protein